jgi:hypothetical protein
MCEKRNFTLNRCSDRGYLRFMADYLDRRNRMADPIGQFIEIPAEIADLYAAALRSIAERIVFTKPD